MCHTFLKPCKINEICADSLQDYELNILNKTRHNFDWTLKIILCVLISNCWILSNWFLCIIWWRNDWYTFLSNYLQCLNGNWLRIQYKFTHHGSVCRTMHLELKYRHRYCMLSSGHVPYQLSTLSYTVKERNLVNNLIKWEDSYFQYKNNSILLNYTVLYLYLHGKIIRMMARLCVSNVFNQWVPTKDQLQGI